MLPVYASICDEAHTGTHGTAVQFTFTNAGAAQTQSRGRLNTVPNYLPCLWEFSFVKLGMQFGFNLEAIFRSQHAIQQEMGCHYKA